MTMIVRDEEDVIEENLAYHLDAGIDFVIATDNASVDGTRAILERYERAGHLRLLHTDDMSHPQAEWSTRMARLAAAEHGADWIVHNDADQFWWPEVDATLREVFAAIPAQYGILTAPKHDFVARAREDRPWVERLTVRPATPPRRPGGRRPEGVSIAIAHRPDPGARVLQGNHALRDTTLEPLPGWMPIYIQHFPNRTYAQFERRIRQGGEAYAINRAAPPHAGRHKRELYEVLKGGGLEEHWRTVTVVDDDAIAAGLASGALVEDVRLRDRLAALRAWPGVDPRYRLPEPARAAETAVRPDLVRALEGEVAAAREEARAREAAAAEKRRRAAEADRRHPPAGPLTRLAAAVRRRRSRG
jgi:hypothetical protein